MNNLYAVCPQCRSQVVFAATDDAVRCPVCGFSYQWQPPRISAPARKSTPGWLSVLKVLMLVALIMVAMAILGVGILYAGCAMAMGH